MREWTLARAPCLRAFREEMNLPISVLGPGASAVHAGDFGLAILAEEIVEVGLVWVLEAVVGVGPGWRPRLERTGTGIPLPGAAARKPLYPYFGGGGHFFAGAGSGNACRVRR